MPSNVCPLHCFANPSHSVVPKHLWNTFLKHCAIPAPSDLSHHSFCRRLIVHPRFSNLQIDSVSSYLLHKLCFLSRLLHRPVNYQPLGNTKFSAEGSECVSCFSFCVHGVDGCEVRLVSKNLSVSIPILRLHSSVHSIRKPCPLKAR